ncbi:MAG: DUF4143 domain-containing protein [Campylobacterota bacterium]|nr:DUF4143 domain-containing protein [Campylobacterota bacterium]
MFNKTSLQSECGLDNKTFDIYFNVLEHTYTDSGVLSYLLQITTADEYETSHYKGNILETFVYAELIKAATYAKKNTELYYYRTNDKKEIDFILEYCSKIVAIEIKSSKTVSKSDFKHIYHLADEIPKEFDKGIVLYNGESVLKVDKNMYAIPLGFLA